MAPNKADTCAPGARRIFAYRRRWLIVVRDHPAAWSASSAGFSWAGAAPALLVAGIVEEFGERPVVWGDGGGVGVFVGAVEAVAADAEDDGVDALLVVEASVCGAVLAQEIGAVSLVGHGLLEAADLWAVRIGVVRRINMIDRGCPGSSGLRILIGSSPERTGLRGREIPEVHS